MSLAATFLRFHLREQSQSYQVKRYVVPTAVLTQSKLVSINDVRPVSTAVSKTSVTRPRHDKTIVTKPNSPPRRHINRSPSPKSNTFPLKVTAVKAPMGNPKHALKDKRVIDSGCSRHMIRNMSYLSDFKELNGGYVVFGGNPKGGKISRKGKIRTGKLDFDDVYFVKELKFNLFIISQMCDKKNSALFTDTECLVLSFEFKLPDENQVLLRVPRENNMYNVNLKNIVPSGDLTCLFAKPTLDEFNLWHRRLGHINFKTMNKLVKGLENQLSLKVKAIRSDNGTKLKNNDLNQFCGMKGIKREFSLPRTPQQNGIAERKNGTLIEAARTMLADSLLPIPFWAEAVNTACYVQNRVLVTKPQNKTPYELLHGRTPSISFIRPFGCPVTILNTLDSLDKFDRKVDEGFLVGYYVSRKAFRVFNSRTRIVQETLHVNFLENKPNVIGSGPTWLFDIDILTKTMNYQPVTAGNQSNPSAGVQEQFDAEKAGEEIVQQYVLFPVWSFEFEDLSDNSIDEDNAACTLVPAVRQLSPNNTNTFSAAELEDITYSDDEDDVSAKADFNNLETFITVSPIPTTRAHKDHHVTQIIGDLSSATQTRKEPKRVHQSLKDPSWIEAIQKELLQFKMQKVWVLVDLPHGKRAIGGRNCYEQVFAPVVRIEAIRIFLAYASFMGFMVYQVDVKSAFLYGTIEEEVYVCQPRGFEDLDYPDKVYKVVKALYGLHQAPRAWYETLANYLLENGFQRGKIDQTLFIKRQKGDIMLVQIYVDDIIFGSTNKDLCKSFEKLMKEKFQMSLIGELTFFLGLQVKQKKDGIFISQDKYVAEILRKFVVATSSTEAEYVAAASCCAQVLWIQNQLLDYGPDQTVSGKDSSNPLMADNLPKIVWYSTHHVTLMKSWLVQKQTALGKEKSNPLMADNLPKIVWYSTHHVTLMKSWLVQKQTALGQTTTGKEISNSFMAGVNTPRCDEDRLELMELMVFLLPSNEKVRIEVSAVDLQVSTSKLILLLLVQKFLLFGREFNFSKSIFDSFVRNVDSPTKFYMYPRFLQLMIRKQVGDLSSHTNKYSSPTLTQKVFANMRRVEKGFFRVETPLFEGMKVEQSVDEGNAEVNVEDVSTAGVATEGDVSAADDVVPTAVEELSIPSPTPPTPPPQPSQDQPLTSQVQLTPPQSPHHQPQPSQDAGILIDLLQNLLDTCTTLTRRVKNLEHDKVAQALKITKLKQRVKKFKRRNKASKLQRLKKVGTTQRIETSDDTVMDDVSEHGRMIADMDVDVDVILEDAKEVDVEKSADVVESIDVQGRKAESQAQIYHIDLKHANKVLSMQDDQVEPAELQEVMEVVTTGKLITEVVTAASTTITTAASQLTISAALTLTTIPSAARRRKRSKEPKPLKKQAQIKEDEAYARELKISSIEKEATEAQARKNMMIYLRNVAGFKMDYFKGMTYDDICLIFEKHFNSNVAFLLKTKEQIDEEDSRALKRLSESQEDKAAKKQKVDEEVEELRKHLMIVPNKEDDVYTEATPLARKVPVVDYEIYNENNKPYYKIKRADGSHQLYLSFLSMLRNFDREDLEVLWQLVKERFTFTKPKNFSNDFLLTTLGAMYPLTRFTLDQMLNNARLKVEEESEVSLELLRELLYDYYTSTARQLKTRHIIIFRDGVMHFVARSLSSAPSAVLRRCSDSRDTRNEEAELKPKVWITIVIKSVEFIPKDLESVEKKLAWDRVSEIKDAFGNKQYKPEDVQELIQKLFNDVENIHEELAEYINTSSWNRPAFYNYNDDDDEDYTIAITPVLLTEEPVDSLIMKDEHLDTISTTELDEVIKSSVEDLFPILNQFEDFFYSNDDSTSINDDSFSIDEIDYVEASPPHFKLVSLGEVKDFHPEDGEIEDDIIRENLLKINLLIAKIESLNDNPTPDHVLKSPSLFLIPVEDSDSFFENSDTSLSYSDNSLPKFETFSDHTKETSSGSTTIHADNSLPKYDSFLFEIEPDKGELTSVVMKDILGEPRFHVPNVLPTHLTLMLDSDFIPSDNSLPESEIFCFDIEEKNSGSTIIYADISLLDLECFYLRVSLIRVS
nr:hypothetical protein [Tanacetum cinerariifolium]